VLDWFEAIGAEELGDGWWHLPMEIVNGIPGFNPVTVPDTGTLSLSVYGGPDFTVEYSKTQLIIDAPIPNAVQQTQRLFWNGTTWVTNQNSAAWVTEAPQGGVQFDHREVEESPGWTETVREAWTETVVDREAWSETLYATANGGSTANRAEAAWLTSSPGAQWSQLDSRLRDWSTATEWARAEGHADWTLGYNPGAQPGYYAGYDGTTQRFRPEAERWKLTLAEEESTVEEDVTGPLAIEAGGGPLSGGLGLGLAIAAGVLIAGGVAVPYTVIRRKATAKQ
jgi:hypothetical protein